MSLLTSTDSPLPSITPVRKSTRKRKSHNTPSPSQFGLDGTYSILFCFISCVFVSCSFMYYWKNYPFCNNSYAIMLWDVHILHIYILQSLRTKYPYLHNQKMSLQSLDFPLPQSQLLQLLPLNHLHQCAADPQGQGRPLSSFPLGSRVTVMHQPSFVLLYFLVWFIYVGWALCLFLWGLCLIYQVNLLQYRVLIQDCYQ